MSAARCPRRRSAVTDRPWPRLARAGNAQAGGILEAVEAIAADGDVADQWPRLGAPFDGQRLVPPGPVLGGKAAENGVAGLEALGFVVERGDQLVIDAAGCKAALELAARTSCARRGSG